MSVPSPSKHTVMGMSSATPKPPLPDTIAQRPSPPNTALLLPDSAAAGRVRCSAWVGEPLLRVLRPTPFLQRTFTLFLIGSAVDQAPQERLEVRRQDLGFARLGIDVDDTGFTPRPALAVVEHDGIVPGRRGPPYDDPDLRKAARADHVPGAELLGIDPPPAPDRNDGGHPHVIVRPARAAGRVTRALRGTAVLRPEQPEVRLGEPVAQRPLDVRDHRLGEGRAGVILRTVEEIIFQARAIRHRAPLDLSAGARMGNEPNCPASSPNDQAQRTGPPRENLIVPESTPRRAGSAAAPGYSSWPPRPA